MTTFIELLKAVLFGIVEGVTEWLPISSTGHLILLEEFVGLKVYENAKYNDAFIEMFNVVIQLGAIFAVLVLFFHKLNPFSPQKTEPEKKNTWNLWLKVIVAVLPSAVIGLVLDDWMDEHLYNYVVVALALVVYGVAFLFIEKANAARGKAIGNVYDLDYKTALLIGAFQCLALIPGTSRSGSTILGAILLGISRPAGAEFSFFLAIPTMLGASAWKILGFLKDGVPFTGLSVSVLLVGCAVSFVVSWLVIKALMEYVRKHSFSAFGIYRIALGALVLGYFVIKTLV